MLAASLRSTSYFKTQTKLYYSEQIITKYKTSTNSYEKGSLIKALANYSWNYKFIVNELFPRNNKTKTPDIIKSNCAEALVQLRSNPFFGKELGLSKNNISKELNAIFKRCIKQGCVATKAIVAEFYTNPVMNFKKVYKDLGFLKKAQSSLVLPRNIETHIVLEKAIAFLEDRPNNAIKKSTNFTEIDWPLINILKEKKTVIIRTNKGPITLELAPEVAPATVTQFIHLSKAKYYNGKSFHRVVPNFVVQGGCSRGDGWSGFDITVMSEFNYKLDYKDQGYVGMASAGKDTESNQFFITHSPTLHLAGNYTAFAKVRLGMEIVDSIQVGDIIKSIDFK